MKNSLLFLGTGGSLGVPVVACPCEVCHSTSSKNKRLRCAALLKIEGKQILIDPGPDLRLQCLRAEIKHLDGVIVTHKHQDHAGGIDELRVFPFFNGKWPPFLLSNFSHEELGRRFYYIRDKFHFQTLEALSGQTDFLGIPLRYFTYYQLKVPVLGLRFGNIAYVTDIKEYSDEIIAELQGLDLLILSALRKENPSPAHLLIPDALQLIEKLAPKRTCLIHMTHDVDHDTVNQELPPGVELAYDGLEIPF
jgi:phosphoribosyl 1,2-cyclic phosphate phosphodiesterase